MYKNKKVKLVCLTIAVMMAFTSVLTACGKKDSPQTGDVSNNTTAATSTAGTASGDTSSLEPYEITQYIVNIDQPDLSTVVGEMNKILKDKINATLNLKILDWGSYDQKIKVIISASEDYDLCFTAPWLNNYYDNVNKGAFMELDELLPQYAPKAYAAIPTKFWDAARVKGKIYGFLNYQIFARTDAVAFQKALTDKYSFDPTKVSKLEDMEPFLENISKKDKDLLPIHQGANEGSLLMSNMINYMGYEELAGHIPGAIKQDDTTGTIVNQYESVEFQNMFKLMRKWYQAGYFRKDIATITDVTNERRAGKFAIESEGTYKPGGIAELANMTGKKAEDYIEVQLSKPFAATGGIIATMFGLSKTSKDPARAMMYLEEINTNSELYNLMCFGIKDKHYTQDADGYVTAIADGGYNPVTDWEFGNQFNALYRAGNDKGNWELTKKINEEAKISPLTGFAFDSTPVKTEIAQCQAVMKEYYYVLGTGSGDYEKVYPQFIEKLKNAGGEKIIAEMQKQVNDWKAVSGK